MTTSPNAKWLDNADIDHHRNRFEPLAATGAPAGARTNKTSTPTIASNKQGNAVADVHDQHIDRDAPTGRHRYGSPQADTEARGVIARCYRAGTEWRQP